MPPLTAKSPKPRSPLLHTVGATSVSLITDRSCQVLYSVDGIGQSAVLILNMACKYSTPQIMSVSGHHNEDMFWEYVKLSLDEKAEQVFLSSADGMF